MTHAVKRMTWICAGLIAVTALTGCTNWEKKYKSLDVEHQNLKGLYENCVTSLDGQAGSQASMQQKLADCQAKLATASQQAKKEEDTGFKVGQVKVDQAAGTITVTLENKLLFSSGKATLKRATSSELDHIYSVIRRDYAGKMIDVVGHTDTDPIRKTKNLYKDNWDLSAERALTVLRYLIDRGIAKQQICAVACGEARPVSSNASSSGKAKNRRVEIVVHTR
ncbi:MAG: OmpA/MotB family protein [Planctomycetota bacterium]|jgi:chemotaxis protein MotB